MEVLIMYEERHGFEIDKVLERLLALRDTDCAQYLTYPNVVREVVEQYESEKKESLGLTCDTSSQTGPK
jgi:hypothetical protein